jgi:hemerythrin-like domain-containing protein
MDIAELLREHILKEQDGVFPAALAALSPEEWDAVDAVRSRVGSSLPATSL